MEPGLVATASTVIVTPSRDDKQQQQHPSHQPQQQQQTSTPTSHERKQGTGSRTCGSSANTSSSTTVTTAPNAPTAVGTSVPASSNNGGSTMPGTSGNSTPTTQQRMSGRCIKRPRKDDDDNNNNSSGNNNSGSNNNNNNSGSNNNNNSGSGSSSHNNNSGSNNNAFHHHHHHNNTSSPKTFVARRLQQDGTSSSPKSTNPERTRRSWDLWTPESKDWFFEALCEFGKDFDAIYNSMAAKSRKSKTQQGEMTFKNKDQVRYFYYRTWHKVSKALGYLGDMKKSVQELYGLINYSEMRKKIGFKALNPTNAPRLLELVLTGQTVIKVKCKNYRVKTPVCRALRLINNVPDKGWEGPKIPAQITIELRPIDNAAWTHVQSLAQNPRVRVTCFPQRKVASIVELMEARWQPGHIRKKNSLLAALEGLETPRELRNSIFQFTAPCKLQLRVFPNQQPKAIEFLLADTYSGSDVCLNSYRIRAAKREEALVIKNEMKSDCGADPSGVSESRAETKDDKPVATASSTGTASSSNNNKCGNVCDVSANLHPTPQLNANKKDSRERKLSFFGSSERCERSVSALVNEEANDGLASNVAGGSTSQAPTGNEDKAKVEKDGPVGEGWTASSLSVLTVGDLYLRLGCPTSIVLYYKFEGADFPAPENRVRNIMDKLITVLLATFCDKRPGLAQPKSKPHQGAMVSSIPSKPKRERLLERAARDLPNEFAVPQGQAPRTSKRTPISLDSIRVELPSGNKRQRARRKPISAMVLQRPLLPRTNPVAQGAVPLGVGGAPQSVPSGVVVRNIVPVANAPEVENSLDKIISSTIVNEGSLDRIIASTLASSQPSPLPDIVPADAEGTPNEVALNSCLGPSDGAVHSMDLRGSPMSTVTALTTTTITTTSSVPIVSNSLETPKKTSLNLNELDQNVSMSSLDFSPLLSTASKQWLNGEGSNLSLGSLLNSFESLIKTGPAQSTQPDSNSNLESRLPDVEIHLQSLLNESSLDYASKFADLAAQIARQNTTAGTSGDGSKPCVHF